MINLIKKSWGAIVLFILGFFLIKRGIDDTLKQELSLEKAKEDAEKLKILQKEQEEKAKLEIKYEEKKEVIELEAKNEQEKIKQDSQNLKKNLNDQAINNPDEFAEKFREKFDIHYDKGK